MYAKIVVPKATETEQALISAIEALLRHSISANRNLSIALNDCGDAPLPIHDAIIENCEAHDELISEIESVVVDIIMLIKNREV